MRQLFLLISMFLALSLSAGILPEGSSAEAPIWYMIRFMNGGAVLEARVDGEQVQTAVPTATDAQYWRFEGTASAGYKIISRSGMTLYTNTTATNGVFSASKAPSSNTLFIVKDCVLSGYTDGFLISPKANSGVYMNQWGGAGTGKPLGLWNSVDSNCPLQFITKAEYEEGMKLASLPLVPMPTDIKLVDGNVDMSLLAKVSVVAPAEQESAVKAVAQQYAEMLGSISGVTMSLAATQSADGQSGCITLVHDASVAVAAKSHSEEAYRLSMTPDGNIVVRASEAHGFFNALQTLRQLFYDAKFNHGGKMQIVEAFDAPLFAYRGFMLDISRHYFDKTEVKKLLDVMALYKVNKFHWHLTDDQGWRIEIPEYPLLTEIGAIRSGSNTMSSNPRFYDDTEYGHGMYYTLDDLREIVDYASRLHIDILPEIDLPGHMVAAVTSYPKEFSCDSSKSYAVRIDQGISTDVLNVAKPEVMDFLKCVLSHVADVFPYPVIHIGGDECPTTAWTTCKDIPAFLKANGLASVNDIQPWLVNELGIWLKEEYGKDVVCWNELTGHWKSSYATKPIIMCYSDYGQNAMKAATNLGLRTIYTGCWPFYLDMYQTYEGNYNQSAAHQFDDCYSGGYGNNTLQRVYEATPLSNIAGKENLCLGVGANLWTETVNNNKEAEHQFFPRMLALAEVGWLPQNLKNWPSFRQRVQTHFRIFEDFGVNYATYDLEPEPTPNLFGFNEKVEARRLLKDAHPDEVGYPSAGAYEMLSKALAAFESASDFEEAYLALVQALADFKAAPVTQPIAGRTYRIVSASVAWNADYHGSTMYVTEDGKRLRFHYTPQMEPEELFRFHEANGGYQVISRLGNRKVYLGSLNAQAAGSGSATVIRVDAPRVASTSPRYYDYVPGIVLLSAKGGYTADAASSKRLNAQPDGYVYVKSDATVGHTGCWRLAEVTDYAAELQALVKKCERLGILDDEIVKPASALLSTAESVGEDDYDRFCALYAQHLGKNYTPAAVSSPYVLPSDETSYDLLGRRTMQRQGVAIVDKRVRISK